MSSLPEVYEVMRRIESCKSEPNRMYMKSEFEFCARGIELAGHLTSTDRLRHTEPYGPIGKDVFTTEIKHAPIPVEDMCDLILTALTDPEQAKKELASLRKKTPVAVFKVRIAKQHLDKGEAYPYRLIALPLDKKYDPWAQELLDYWHDAGGNLVFDFNRQDNWEYITRKDKIFDGLFYHIKKYHYFPNGTIAEVVEQPKKRKKKQKPLACLSHPRYFKCHAIRHSRADQLIRVYKFDGYDMASFVGWSMGSSNKLSAGPSQAGNYAEIREAWERPIYKLMIPFDYQLFQLDDNKEMKA